MNIKMISALCGTSACTVSRVLSGRAAEFRISEATAQHIREVAGKANYRPNYLARSLNTGRTFNIGLVFANTVDNYLGNIMEGVESHLRGTEYQTVVATGENDIRLQDLALRRMLHRLVDGIILYPQALPSGRTYELPEPVGKPKRHAPIVLIGRAIPVERDQVMMRDYEVGVETARYFLDLGCRRFACLTRPTNCSSDRGRQRGFTETLRKAGIPASRRLVVEEADGPSAEGLRKIQSADALFGVNSRLLLDTVMGLRALKDVRSLRLVSVGAVEGGAFMDLQLRTWTIPGRQIGAQAARLLLWRLEHPAAPWEKVEIPLEWTDGGKAGTTESASRRGRGAGGV